MKFDISALNTGQKISMGIALYIIAKQILNILLGGFSGVNLLILLFGLGAGYCFYAGVKKSNLIVAVIMMLVACAYLPGNFRGGQWLYLIEGVIDIVCAGVLVFHPDIRTHCKMSR